ncbi:sugar ABC transporter ATP-binding protein [Paenibacillus aceris]|uniref:Ribose transport system ATP-binding protein n=1 Tax=Paenibacillus aceris TaxID=869555 RepID=A0ABS4HVW7_9BACL|nr:sugar ABC transporter ATP-binding protein [Paenibacillus aceris]MBP1962809.1 ribose transport system ATP-binding protein [Paenibacillus aceris]NHW38239.1 sugar ABC transporter ATP-binding protein [Paenibacillus aceris]
MNQISKTFGMVKALKEVDLELHHGEVMALLGENGAGKSTLMNILCGATSNYEGEIRINGQPVQISSPTVASKHGVVKIHQELQLVPELTVAENIFLGREERNHFGFIDYKMMNAKAQTYMKILDLTVPPQQQVKRLRIGEQQLVEIAKALSLDAKILIMDEPTTALSKHETEKLFQVVKQLSAKGVSIIYITHRMEEIFELSDRVVVLRDGSFVGAVATVETNHNELVRMMVGRSFAELFPHRDFRKGKEVLRVENLSFHPPITNGKRKLKEVSLTLHQGEILGISGLLGAGRSELFECLFGLHVRRCTGNVYIHQQQVMIKNPRDAIDKGLAFLTEDRKGQGLVLGRSIGENMSLPLLDKFSRLTFMMTKQEKVVWDEQIRSLSIKAPSYATQAKQLSGGNQQKVIIGKWLLSKPMILLLDEPTRGIDVNAKAEIYEVIHQLARSGMGILLISSDMPEILGLSDRILTICEGRITGEFMRAEATEEKLLKAATEREVTSSHDSAQNII